MAEDFKSIDEAMLLIKGVFGDAMDLRDESMAMGCMAQGVMLAVRRIRDGGLDELEALNHESQEAMVQANSLADRGLAERASEVIDRLRERVTGEPTA